MIDAKWNKKSRLLHFASTSATQTEIKNQNVIIITLLQNVLQQSLLVLIILLYWKQRFSREHTKNANVNVQPRPNVTFWAVGYHLPPPPESQQAFHIYYVKYETYLRAKGLVGTRWDWCFKNIFLFPICLIKKIDNFSPKLKQYIYGNGKPSAKLIYEDGNIWSTLIFNQNYRQRYTVIPITTVRGPSKHASMIKVQYSSSIHFKMTNHCWLSFTNSTLNFSVVINGLLYWLGYVLLCTHVFRKDFALLAVMSVKEVWKLACVIVC